MGTAGGKKPREEPASLELWNSSPASQETWSSYENRPPKAEGALIPKNVPDRKKTELGTFYWELVDRSISQVDPGIMKKEEGLCMLTWAKVGPVPCLSKNILIRVTSMKKIWAPVAVTPCLARYLTTWFIL